MFTGEELTDKKDFLDEELTDKGFSRPRFYGQELNKRIIYHRGIYRRRIYQTPIQDLDNYYKLVCSTQKGNKLRGEVYVRFIIGSDC